MTNEELGFASDPLGMLAPGSTATVVYTAPVGSEGTNTAVVTGSPVLPDGTMIPELESVSESDPSSIELLPFEPSVRVENTVRCIALNSYLFQISINRVTGIH